MITGGVQADRKTLMGWTEGAGGGAHGPSRGTALRGCRRMARWGVGGGDNLEWELAGESTESGTFEPRAWSTVWTPTGGA